MQKYFPKVPIRKSDAIVVFVVVIRKRFSTVLFTN